MNSSQHTIFILIAILVCFVYNSYHNSENFTLYSATDSSYAPIGTYGINNQEKSIPLTRYANQVAYDLQNPFSVSSVTGGNSRVPWQPNSYREVQEPDGQFVGILSPN